MEEIVYNNIVLNKGKKGIIPDEILKEYKEIYDKYMGEDKPNYFLIKLD